MSGGENSPISFPARLVMITAAVVLMIALILTVERIRARAGPALVATAAAPVPHLEPISAEADVFRTRPRDFAVDAEVARRADAHPRDLAMYRTLRAYPGAPPRIPHGLTREEYRNTGCTACHERGGFSNRFASYTPMTPHPEFSDCLQCHLPDARLVGIGFPDGSASALCRQCHAREGTAPVAITAVDWRPAAWPRIGQRDNEEAPPLIPHDSGLRGNCVACHYGPAAVEEVRTSHGDRADCRQCHLPATPEVAAFQRVPIAFGDSGGAP